MDEMTLKEAYDCIYGGKSCSSCKYSDNDYQKCLITAHIVISKALEELIEKEGE